MKLIRCYRCGDVVALSAKTRECHCSSSSGRYTSPKDVTVNGPCLLFGVDNSVFAKGRAEAFVIERYPTHEALFAAAE